MPAGVAPVVIMVRVDVPVPPAVKATGLTLNEVVRPVTGLAVDADRVTLPKKPLTLARVIVEVAEEPDVIATLVGLAETPKSADVLTLRNTVAEWLSNPPVPVTKMVYVPVGVAAVVVIVRTEVPDPPGISETGLVPKENVRPVTGVAVDAARVTLPVKP